MRKLTDLQKVSIDTFKGINTANFSSREGEEILREEIGKLICRNGVPNIHAYNKNKHDLFELMEEILLPVAEPYTLPAELQSMIRIENIAEGEYKEFNVEFPELFKAYKVSDGNIDIRRQTVAGRKLVIPTAFEAIKIYAELADFVKGKIDWASMVSRVNKSFENIVARNIAKLFDSVANPIDTASGTFNADTLAQLIEKVEEKYSSGAIIYGKKSVLGKVQDVVQSEVSKQDFNAIGYYGQFRGTPMMQLPTDSADLVILPYNGSPIGIVVREGAPLVLETSDFGTRNDLQLELIMRIKLGYATVDVSGATYTLA